MSDEGSSSTNREGGSALSVAATEALRFIVPEGP